MILIAGMVLFCTAADSQGEAWLNPTPVDSLFPDESPAGPSGDSDLLSWAKPMTWEEVESWRSLSRSEALSGAADLTNEGSPSEALLQGDKEKEKEKTTSGGTAGNLSVHGQWSVPFGHAYGRDVTYRGVTVTTRSVKWEDIYEPGWGVDVQGDIFFGGKGDGVNSGLGILFSSDVYGRGTIPSAFQGDFVTSNLVMDCLLVGLTLSGGTGPGFFGKGFFGVGPVHYSTVTATISGVGITQFEAGFVRNTWTIASDFKGEVGYRFGAVALLLGFGVRIQAPPNEGTDFDVHSGAFFTYDVIVGIEFGL